MPLSEIQKRFTYSLLAKQNSDDEEILNVLNDREGVSVENRLKVYRNNLVQNLSGAVMAAFPMTRILVGEEFLKKAVRTYIFENLPEEGNLNSYGCTFPEFLRDYPPAIDIPYLYDFTRLEWAGEHAFYAEDDVVLDVAALAEIAEDELPELKLYVRASLSLIKSDYPLDQIMDACRNGEVGQVSAIEEREVYMLVCRPFLQVETYRITAGEFYFLDALQKGMSIQQAALLACEADATFDLAPVLQKYLSAQIFAGYQHTLQDA